MNIENKNVNTILRPVSVGRGIINGGEGLEILGIFF